MGTRTLALGKGSLTAAALMATIAVGGSAFCFLVASYAVPSARLPTVAVGLALLLGFGRWAQVEARRNRGGDRTLTVSETDGLTIVHPDALRAPLHVPRALIRAIHVDTGDDAHRRHPVERRFSWSAPTAADEGLAGYLWTADDDGDELFPLLGGPKDRPTVAVILHLPMSFDAARAARARFADARSGRATIDRETPIRGFLLAADAFAANDAFASWDERVDVLLTEHFASARPADVDDVLTELGVTTSEPAAAPLADTKPPAPPTASVPPPARSVPPPGAAPTRPAAPVLPRAASAAHGRTLAFLLALGFLVPFTLVVGGLFGLTALMLSHRISVWALFPAAMAIGLVRAAMGDGDEADHGVAVGPDVAPELHALIAATARDIDAALPAEVRITFGPFDAIGERERGRATLWLGLPTIAAYDRDALRVVIAHELAHLRLHHTAIGRITGRTLTALDDLLEHLAALERRSHIFGTAAIPLTALLSRYRRLAVPAVLQLRRANEIAADEIAATACGPTVTTAELELGHAVHAAFRPWIDEELIPTLDQGRRPALAASFAAYLERPDVQRRIGPIVAAQAADLTLQPHRTHPPLGLRLELARKAATPARAADRRPAIELLPRLDAVEQQLLAGFAGAERVAALAPERVAA
jgi:Zn-dependent protease with chaperone function